MKGKRESVFFLFRDKVIEKEKLRINMELNFKKKEFWLYVCVYGIWKLFWKFWIFVFKNRVCLYKI